MKNPPKLSASMYESAEKIYSRNTKGRFTRLRMCAMLGLLGAYYLMPWLQLAGHPLLLFDLPARRFHLFGLTLFPQDLFLLAALLVLAAMTLFLFTTVAGRVWCGFSCPQTVWTEAFMWIERLIEGDSHQRQKLDRATWSASKVARKAAKHAAWAAFGLYTGLTFVSYFMPAREVFHDAATLSLAGWPLFWGVFYGFTTWGFAGFMREQVCKYMCPYARFQSSMFDKDTLIVAYDQKRGEPRKGVVKLAELRQQGDCVSCTLCVQACPVGIDIRDGLQYECIACAACVDACDTVMDRVGKPHGLIRYTSQHQDEGGRFRLLRPRSIGYGVVWLILVAGFGYLLMTRAPVGLDILRDRRQLYREMADGRIANIYTLKIENKSDQPHEFRIAAKRADGTAVELSEASVTVNPSSIESVIVAAMLPAPQAVGVQTLAFDVNAVDDNHLHGHRDARFIGASH